MRDRELLEAAAKASGVDAEWHNDDDAEFDAAHEGMFLKGCRGPSNSKYWNPLTDDGDALRLAVALNIGVQCHVYQGSGYVLAQCGQGSNDAHAITIAPGDDPAAATRRAIVRAAAEMAKEPK